jgi:hypothetical protein
MTLLATLYPAYNATDFDLEAATDVPKRLVITFGDAVRWAELEMNEGRGEPLEWKITTYEVGKSASWECECNEDNEPEEWILIVQEVPFAFPQDEQ